MTRLSWITLATCFALGVVAGIYVQHRWPVGRWRAEMSRDVQPAEPALADLAAIPRERRLVLLCLGQSNAANYGSARSQAGPKVYAFAGGRLYVAKDPLPGGDGYGGSIWTRLGARIAATGDYDAVVFAVAAQGSSYAADWAAGGSRHAQLTTTLEALASANLRPDAVLWVQGEQEAREAHTSAAAYAAQVRAVAAECRRVAPHAPFYVAVASFGAETNEQIPLAQRQLTAEPGFAAGPDLDQLRGPYRSDGIHFNEDGLQAAAERWFEALAPTVNRQRR